MTLSTIEADALDAEIDRLTFRAPRAERARAPAPQLQRALVAVDPAGGNDELLAWAERLAVGLSATIELVSVTPPQPPMYYAAGAGSVAMPLAPGAPALNEQAEAQTHQRLEEAQAKLAARTPRAHNLAGDPARGIVETAEREEADVIIVGPGARGAERFILGSVARSVLHHSHGSVLSANARPGHGPVLAAVDGSEESRSAALVADAIARAFGSQLVLLHVYMRSWRTADDEAMLAELHAREAAGETPLHLPHVRPMIREGDPRGVIEKVATDTNASLIVVGNRGLSGWKRVLLGSVGAQLAPTSRTPVLVVRSKE